MDDYHPRRRGPLGSTDVVEDAVDDEGCTKIRNREASDEAYVVSLCDEVLGTTGLRQHTFDFLRGDAGKRRQGRRLRVDVYYPSLNLVVEYRERQHTDAVPFFDKPHRVTVSGVHRGLQRERYDQRRRDVLPQHGITLVEVATTDLAHDNRQRLLRKRTEDAVVLRGILGRWIGSSSNTELRRAGDPDAPPSRGR
jgi:hypothetical protein